MSDFTFPSNINREEFYKGYQARQKEAGFVSDIGNAVASPFRMVKNKVNSAVEGYMGDRMGAAMKPTLDSARQAGIQFDTNEQGMPINFNANKTINTVGKNYLSDLTGQVGSWMGNHWNQAKADPIGWAKNNPWTAGGVAALGGGLLYGGTKALGSMFGGGGDSAPAPRPQPQAYGIPTYHGAYGPQALQKAGEFGLPVPGMPMLHSSVMFPNQLASQLSRFHSPQQRQQQEQSEYSPNFIPGDKKVEKLLADPRMKSYLVSLLSNR